MSGPRHRLLVCYDVRDPVRLRRTYNCMLGYGDPVQYSVFLCELSAPEQVLMEEALRDVVKTSEDSLVIVDLGPARGLAARRIRILGGSTMMPVRRRYRIV
jgi:CRISPR-associated protein Cas2